MVAGPYAAREGAAWAAVSGVSVVCSAPEIVMAPISINLLIVDLLKRYRRALPIDYLAQATGQRRPEIEEHIRVLESAHIIRRTGDSVDLVSEPPGRQAVS